MRTLRRFVVAALVVSAALPVHRAAAQDLFEIQVYPYQTVEPGRTMVELHTNYFASGSKSRHRANFRSTTSRTSRWR
jgi:hypothetical protein